MPEAVCAPRSHPAVPLDGARLELAELVSVARDGARVEIAPGAVARMSATEAVLLRAARGGEPIYGVSTGLGSRVGEPVTGTDGADYARRTIRGRAVAVGEPLSRELTRAAMVVRLQGLCAAGAGASPGLAAGLAALLNHGVHPRIPSSGSIGASDLCLMAHVGLTLIGEGEAELDGRTLPAGEALRVTGLAPLALGPRDGLAICSSSAVSIGAAALALADARAILHAAQVSAALSMEGFRANLGPLDPAVVAARPAPGQAWASDGLRALLSGGALERRSGGAVPRRLQDPLSFRCAAQLHGSLHTALAWLDHALAPELAGAADSPLVLLDDERVLSTGNFQLPALALALDATAIAVAQTAHGIAQRAARLTEARLSGLPNRLIAPGLDGSATRSGVGPVLKTADALVLEIRAAATPFSPHSGVTADGVEDDSSGAAQAALRLGDQLRRLRLLVALELLVAAQAVDVAGVTELGAGTAAAHRAVRALVPTVEEDRPLGAEIERLQRELVAGGRLVREAGG